MTTATGKRLVTYCVRAQAVRLARDGSHRLYTIHTVAVQARWWGVKMLRWRGVPFVAVSLRKEPEHTESEATA